METPAKNPERLLAALEAILIEAGYDYHGGYPRTQARALLNQGYTEESLLKSLKDVADVPKGET